MLELEVIPERAVSAGQWQFVLGMHLAQAIDILKRQCTVIKNVQLRYSDQRPLDTDLVVDMVQDGLRLLFDPKLQRLKMIEIYDVKKVKLKYCNSYFSSPEITPTVEQIHHTFGPTLPGQHDSKQQVYLLLFRGILLVFPTLTPPLVSGIGMSTDPQPSSMVLSRVCIFSGNDPAEAKAPSRPLECYRGSCYSESVEVNKEDGVVNGVKLSLIADDSHHSKTRLREFEKVVRFGDTVQDVLGALGSPNKLFYKAEDKMRIHSPLPHKLPVSKCSDYFFNYFTLGMDILFDAYSHKVKKFILHTNLPGHYNFNIYYHCNFTVSFPMDQKQQQQLQQQLQQQKQRQSGMPATLTVTPSTKWSDVQIFLTRPTDKPVVLNRSSSTNSSNPFGSTYCYGYQNMIFEVMRNNYIASLTLYSP